MKYRLKGSPEYTSNTITSVDQTCDISTGMYTGTYMGTNTPNEIDVLCTHMICLRSSRARCCNALPSELWHGVGSTAPDFFEELWFKIHHLILNFNLSIIDCFIIIICSADVLQMYYVLHSECKCAHKISWVLGTNTGTNTGVYTGACQGRLQMLHTDDNLIF